MDAASCSFQTQKRVPKPAGPLKSFNWLKLTEAKVKGTAWEFIEDEKMFKQVSFMFRLADLISRLWLEQRYGKCRQSWHSMV